MSDQRKALWHCLLTTAIVVLELPCVAAAQVAAQCGDIHILSTELPSQDAEAYCQYAASERAKVETFWGTTWQAPIRIHVDSVYRIAKALVPVYQGKRGFMEMPLRRVLNNDGGLVHEFVHIYAPNANRFLAEGLAVYLQARLGGNRAFPNFGEDIRRLAVRGLTGLESLDALHPCRPPSFGHGHGGKDRVYSRRVVRRIHHRALWPGVVSSRVRDGQLRTGVWEVPRDT